MYSNRLTLDILDGEGKPIYEHTIDWDSNAIPMGIYGEPDSTGEGDPSIVESVEWSPTSETMTLVLCPAAIEQYEVKSSACADCVIVPGTLDYIFDSTAFDSPKTVSISGTQIMLNDFVEQLESELQPLTIEVNDLGIITIGAIGDSVTVTTPMNDPFNFNDEELISKRGFLDLIIYYTYFELESKEIPKDIYISG